MLDLAQIDTRVSSQLSPLSRAQTLHSLEQATLSRYFSELVRRYNENLKRFSISVPPPRLDLFNDFAKLERSRQVEIIDQLVISNRLAADIDLEGDSDELSFKHELFF